MCCCKEVDIVVAPAGPFGRVNSQLLLVRGSNKTSEEIARHKMALILTWVFIDPNREKYVVGSCTNDRLECFVFFDVRHSVMSFNTAHFGG